MCVYVHICVCICVCVACVCVCMRAHHNFWCNKEFHSMVDLTTVDQPVIICHLANGISRRNIISVQYKE